MSSVDSVAQTTLTPVFPCCRENSQTIQIANDIEADEVTYKEELIEEQDEKKRDMMAALDMERKNSVTARFQRRQKTSEDQEEVDRRWKRIQARMKVKVVLHSSWLL